MKRLLVIVLMGLSTMAVSAKSVGSQWLRQLSVYNDSVFGVSTAVPTGFVGGADAMNLMEYAPNDTWGSPLAGNRGRYLYCATVLSKDQECMILYPYLIFVRSKVDTTPDLAFACCQKQVGRVLTKNVKHILWCQKCTPRCREYCQKNKHCQKCNDNTNVVFKIFYNSIFECGCHNVFSSFTYAISPPMP